MRGTHIYLSTIEYGYEVIEGVIINGTDQVYKHDSM